MKSIKEKALEHGLLNPVIHYDADGNTYDDHDKPSNDFEEGANYVLEQIESILPFVAKKGIVYGKIKETIEQLKSNQ